VVTGTTTGVIGLVIVVDPLLICVETGVALSSAPERPNGFTRPDTDVCGNINVVSTKATNEGFCKIPVFNLICEIFLSIVAISLPANDDADAAVFPSPTGLVPVLDDAIVLVTGFAVED